MEIVECHIEVELITNKAIQEGCSMIKITEVTLGEGILEEHIIIEVRILELDIEVILGMTTLEEVEEGLEKDGNQVILDEMTKVVADPDHIDK